jgi:hypothetical protein
MPLSTPKSDRVLVSKLPPAEKDHILQLLAASKEISFDFDPREKAFVTTVAVVRDAMGQVKKVKQPKQETNDDRRHANHDIQGSMSQSHRHRGSMCYSAFRPNESAGVSPGESAFRSEESQFQLDETFQGLRSTYPRFCSSLAEMAQPLRLQTIDELLRFMQEFYEHCYKSHIKQIKKEAEAPTKPDRRARCPETTSTGSTETKGTKNVSVPGQVWSYIKSRHGMNNIVNRLCWEIAHSASSYRSQNQHVNLFFCFLSGNYKSRDLLLFLFCRDIAARILNTSRDLKGSMRLVRASLKLAQCQSLVATVLPAGEARDEVLEWLTNPQQHWNTNSESPLVPSEELFF